MTTFSSSTTRSIEIPTREELLVRPVAIALRDISFSYPDNPNVHYYLGLCYLGKGVNDKSKMHFERLLEIAPDHENAAEAKEFLSYL